MQFDDFYTEVQCEEVYDNFLDFIEFQGFAAMNEIFTEEEFNEIFQG